MQPSPGSWLAFRENKVENRNIMKVFTIPRKRIRTELIWLLGCFMAALAYQASAVIRDTNSWSGLFTSWHVVVILALVFYVLLLFLRGLVTLVIRFSARNN
jgi:hypothetical protein